MKDDNDIRGLYRRAGADQFAGRTKPNERFYRRPFFFRTIGGKVSAIQAHAQHRRLGQELAADMRAEPADRFEAKLEKTVFIG